MIGEVEEKEVIWGGIHNHGFHSLHYTLRRGKIFQVDGTSRELSGSAEMEEEYYPKRRIGTGMENILDGGHRTTTVTHEDVAQYDAKQTTQGSLHKSTLLKKFRKTPPANKNR
ncbi:hypothetical protein L195_g051692 [Trifolium pratense]|uniref:Uncharacterized protein n=1 Tax=Trifolium pratense TaxID=57577 RepID=A0A2K3K0Z2_TRIPR|nr:hypothetical protein L195_g051692 [Trifolium pratense]